ncbi:SpvB/TcaC N-terminal domain-containing protein [Rhizobium mongolense]
MVDQVVSGNSDISAAWHLPSFNLPKGGGAIRGIGEKVTANPATGSATMSVPIATSPGRAGFGPALSLSYDSGLGNGPFGFGWSLSLPAITRKTDKGIPQYNDAGESDVLVLSGAEDLVPAFRTSEQGELLLEDGDWVPDDVPRKVAGTTYKIRAYRPRVEGLFARIERWTHPARADEVFWRTISRDNITSWYGLDKNSRLFDPDSHHRIFSWLICRSHDDRGNVLEYRYKSEDAARIFESADGSRLVKPHEANRTPERRSAQRYIKSIRYGNRTPYLPTLGEQDIWPAPVDALTEDASHSWLFEVVFDYGEHKTDAPSPVEPGVWPCRDDPFSTYRAGFELRTYRLCRRVLMFHHFEGTEADGVGTKCLVRSTEFTYAPPAGDGVDQGPSYSFLTQVVQSGFRRTDDGYMRKSLPPLSLDYSRATVGETVQAVDADSLANLPAGLDERTYHWTDLYGEGLPGILTEQGGGWFYKRNLTPIAARSPDRPQGPRVEFAPIEAVAARPSAALTGGAMVMDLAGDGLPDIVTLNGPLAGLYENDEETGGWKPFLPFTSRLGRDFSDPNVKLIDLDGDGRPEVLISEDDAFVWHPSRGESGFGPAERVAKAVTEEAGPRVVFADKVQSIHLADLSGDGLADIVRIRSGEICYWPSLGYGRFGSKIVMDAAPCFDVPDRFDPGRIRLADIDGSGTTDIIYLHPEGVRLFFNRSGNGWSRAHPLSLLPHTTDLATILPVDLFGNGTACLVWSSRHGADGGAPMLYVDLMGGSKPHLLTRVDNNLGAETRISYASSTRFYLADRKAGRPWLTRLPFPVQVVERVETWDHIGRSLFTSRYAYRHGYFDGEEREFRGFGMVEQWDAESFAALGDGAPMPGAAGGLAARPTNREAVAHVSPIRTRTWFHTGADLRRDRVRRLFESDYYAGPAVGGAALLPTDPLLPQYLSLAERREAFRALKGNMLRQEIFADDAGEGDTDEARQRSATPYTVTERSFAVRCLQPRGPNRHAVFVVDPREELAIHYERRADDPRVQHKLTLAVDVFGNPLREAAIAYGRRRDDPELAAEDAVQQRLIHMTSIEHALTGPVFRPDAHRTPLPAESSTYELRKPRQETSLDGPLTIRSFTEMAKAVAQSADGEHDIDYEDLGFAQAAAAVADRHSEADRYFRRLIERVRTFYRPDDLGISNGDEPLTLLPLRGVEPLALAGESYKLALTPGLVADVYRRRRSGLPDEPLLADPAPLLTGAGADQGGYVAMDGGWWIPSGRTFFSRDPADRASAELAEARGHFFNILRSRDPFGGITQADFDDFDLLMRETVDAVGNRVTAGERQHVLPDGRVLDVRSGNDYRVLQPRLISDPNRNRQAVSFDALGLVVGTALSGKPEEDLGDKLDGFVSDPDPDKVAAFLARPREPDPDNTGSSSATAVAHELLGPATTRIVYDLDRFQRSRDAWPDQPDRWAPSAAATISRETHGSNRDLQEKPRLQVTFAYADGFGREIMRKVPAEPGPGPKRGSDGRVLTENGQPIETLLPVNPRWTASGWTIFNNKGKPVRSYEPFFTDTVEFEFGVVIGVSPVLFYDPAGRVVATLHPDHSYEKVVFDAWRQVTCDANDTSAPNGRETGDPRTDADIGAFVAPYFAALPEGDEWKTWREQRIDGALGAEAKRAAEGATAHANTPTTAWFDSPGRTFMTVMRNRITSPGHPLDSFTDQIATRIQLDSEGNDRAVRDERRQLDAEGLPRGPKEQRVIMRYAYDMLGNRIHQSSMESGARWMLQDAVGKPIRGWDSRGHTFATAYDAARRPIARTVHGSSPESDPRTLLPAPLTFDRVTYGETLDSAEALNLRTRIFRHEDSAGAAWNAALDATGKPLLAYDFKGNLLRATRRLLADETVLADWLHAPALSAEIFESATTYDALNRPIQSVAPHSTLPASGHTITQPVFNEANLLERVDVWLERAAAPNGPIDPAAEPPSPVGVAGIAYDAKGQRLRIAYKNGAETRYRYDPLTYRLVGVYTRRGAAFTGDCTDGAPSPDTIAAPELPPAGRDCGLQNLSYAYDAVGNIISIRDRAHQPIYFRNRKVEPSSDFVYDALYRLVRATGREHLGQNGHPIPHSHDDAGRVRLPHPGDGRAMARYVEQYVHDSAGNMLALIHMGGDPQLPTGWTRSFGYDEPSLIEDGADGRPLRKSNRLSRASLGNDVIERYTYDAHGNMLRMPNLGGQHPQPNLHWDYADRLRAADLATGCASFGYDAAGERARKVWRKSASLVEKRTYLGGFEVFRRLNRQAGALVVTLERETLHVMDDTQRIALVETRTRDTAGDPAPRQTIRYQFSNHLGSACLELDEAAKIASYEEYSPYGNSTYQATEPPKRFRYTGKERDEETGLSYHGARYYAPWLCRWVSADPIGLRDGGNLYAYTRGNPIGLVDPGGTEGKDPLTMTVEDYHDVNARRPPEKQLDRETVERLHRFDRAKRGKHPNVSSAPGSKRGAERKDKPKGKDAVAAPRGGKPEGNATVDQPGDPKERVGGRNLGGDGIKEADGAPGTRGGTGSKGDTGTAKTDLDYGVLLASVDPLNPGGPEEGGVRSGGIPSGLFEDTPSSPVGQVAFVALEVVMTIISAVRGAARGLFKAIVTEVESRIIGVIVGTAIGIAGAIYKSFTEDRRIASRGHKHHVLPQQQASDFAGEGVDVHEYTLRLSKKEHIRLHSEGWNDAWEEYFAMKRSKRPPIDEYLYQMFQEFRVKWPRRKFKPYK